MCCMPTREAFLGLLLIRPVLSILSPSWGAPLRHSTFCVRRVGAVVRFPFQSACVRVRVGSSHSSRATASTVSSAPFSAGVMAASAIGSSEGSASIHWFRKGLRLHDNWALLEACDGADSFFPLFVLDPDPASPESRAGSLR